MRTAVWDLSGTRTPKSHNMQHHRRQMNPTTHIIFTQLLQQRQRRTWKVGQLYYVAATVARLKWLQRSLYMQLRSPTTCIGDIYRRMRDINVQSLTTPIIAAAAAATSNNDDDVVPEDGAWNGIG